MNFRQLREAIEQRVRDATASTVDAVSVTQRTRDELIDLLRMWPTVIVALLTFAAVYWIAPQQVGILVYTVCKLSIAGYLGYWLDRWIFPNDRVESPDPDKVADDPEMAQKRRAFLVGCCILAAGFMS